MDDNFKPCPYCGGPVEVAEAPNSHESVNVRCGACGNVFHQRPSMDMTDDPEPEEKPAGGKPVDELVDEARRLSREGRHAAAVTRLRAAVNRAPEVEELLMSLGSACSRANLSYDALAAYKRAIDLNPCNEEALFKAAMLLVGQKRYSHGIELLNRLIEINPDAHQAKLMISIARTRQKEEGGRPPGGSEGKSKRRGRLYALVNLAKNPDISTAVLVSAWVIMPVLFAVAYIAQVSHSGSLDAVLVAILVYSLFMGVVCHELGHGAAAFLSGDDTAFRAGRLTMNPVRHISFLGTVIVPITVYSLTGVTFGWAKPVPFNPIKLERQPRDQALVAGAGPFVSFALSYVMFILFVSLAAWHNSLYPGSPIYFSLDLALPMDVGEGFFAPAWFVGLEILAIGSVVNLILGVFNLIPVPPLDGSWLLKAAAPPKFSALLDRSRWLGLVAIIAAVYTGWILYLFYPAFMILALYDFLSRAIL
ncbi:hypothetical protein MNBD_NITROSPINAE02-561 [hydrothermal vent metagenome]|uniref:Peptidase M50 domain-containing protein n=1 Tax=hydrothermal vent metagenome TaxID=652676 RepID=A0A3B1C4N1_9ZZZZ